MGKQFRASLCELVCPDEVPFLSKQPHLPFHGQRGDLVVRVRADECLQCPLVAGVLILAEGRIPAPRQPLQVSIGQGRLRRRIALMEAEQVLVKPDSLQLRRLGIACLGLPCQELRHAVEDRAVGRQLERFLRPGGRLLAGRVEVQRLMNNEIVERRPVTVRHRAFLQEVVPGGDGGGLENGLRCERLLELLVNLGEEPGKVPGCEVLPRLRRRGGALHESPLVLLEIVPIPLGQQGVHQRHHLLGCLGDFGLQAGDLLLGLVALDVSLQRDPLADGLHGFGVGPVLDGALDDRFQVGDGGFGQALLNGLLDALPLGLPWAGVER